LHSFATYQLFASKHALNDTPALPFFSFARKVYLFLPTGTASAGRLYQPSIRRYSGCETLPSLPMMLREPLMPVG
jgi:hypothetical protein